LCGSSVGVEEMGWISPWVLTVSTSRALVREGSPVET
jgi:hypothetical protein